MTAADAPAARPADDRATAATDLAAALARVALGDRQAFEKVYRATSAHLFGVILRIEPDTHRAEDILQDTFVNVWRAAGSFDAARSQASTWLSSVARHRAIDARRRRRTEPPTVSQWVAAGDGADDADDAADLLAAMPSHDPGPLQRQLAHEDGAQVRRCVGELSGPQRQCLALAYYQGLSHAEMAQSTGQPLGTVKSWIRRGLQALRQCLQRAGIAEAGA